MLLNNYGAVTKCKLEEKLNCTDAALYELITKKKW